MSCDFVRCSYLARIIRQVPGTRYLEREGWSHYRESPTYYLISNRRLKELVRITSYQLTSVQLPQNILRIGEADKEVARLRTVDCGDSGPSKLCVWLE